MGKFTQKWYDLNWVSCVCSVYFVRLVWLVWMVGLGVTQKWYERNWVKVPSAGAPEALPSEACGR